MLNLLLTPYKPKISSIDKPLCDFRFTKAYLWGLIYDALLEIQAQKSCPLHVLDAACHSLITRHIFPDSYLYYGLDISKQRLLRALARKRIKDILYLADITKPLELRSCFDVIVSCNTLSHLPVPQILPALSNLLECCRPNGSLIVNIGLSRDFSSVAALLLKNFHTVQPIYLGTHKSLNLENSGPIDSSLIPSYILKYEYSYQNDASHHTQVLFIARDKVSTQFSPLLSPPKSTNSILQLTTIPHVSHKLFETDAALISFLSNNCPFSLIIFSSCLLSSSIGKKIANELRRHNVAIVSIEDLDPSSVPDSSKLLFIGFESQWVGNVGSARLKINFLREIVDISILFAIVKRREEKVCTPSLLMQDY